MTKDELLKKLEKEIKEIDVRIKELPEKAPYRRTLDIWKIVISACIKDLSKLNG